MQAHNIALGSSHFGIGYGAHLFFKRRALGHAHYNIFLFHYFIVLQRYPLFEIKFGYVYGRKGT